MKTFTNPPTATQGTDATKKIVGRKRSVVTDTLGFLLVVIVVAASVTENRAGIQALDQPFADESGMTLRPAWARTWARRGTTPIVKVAGRGGRKLSFAGIVAYRTGQRPRIIYRAMVHRGRKGEPKGFGEDHFADLFDTAHQQLRGPIVLLWDGLPAHKSAKMRALIAARP